jgi:4-carboxymuconolactone decarboxylase
MRLPPLNPTRLAPEQQQFDAAMRAGIARHLHGFIYQDESGALIGPFAPMLRFPEYGKPVWDLFTALAEHTTLPKPCREIAILVTGARFRSRYEIYAHEHVAAGTGLAPAKIATIVAGERPADLTQAEATAYDVAACLARGAQLPEATYRAACAVFSEQGVAELVYLIATYCVMSVVLNAYDVDVPAR